MFYLMGFDPIKPDIGLIFWTSVIFLLFWGIIGRFAFRPIANALKKRESDIQSSLDEAKLARQEMSNLKAENEKLLAEAREERSKILKQAKDAGESIVKEAKARAKDEAQKIVTSAKAEIESQKKQALIEVKNQLGNMALDIAEQVLRSKLKDDQVQQTLVNTLVKEIKLN
jgi:F-type H+-transporting ATPase subunit b